MTRPTLHLLGLPHTVTRPEWSQCAFTASGATLHVDVMSARQQAELLGPRRTEPRQGPADMAHDDPVKIELFTTFNPSSE